MSLDSSLVLVQPSPQMSCTEHLDSSAQPPSQPLPNSTASLDNEPLPDPKIFELSIFIPRATFCDQVKFPSHVLPSGSQDPTSSYLELTLSTQGPETIRELHQSVVESAEGWWLGSFGLAPVDLDQHGQPLLNSHSKRTVLGEFAELATAFKDERFKDPSVKRALEAVTLNYNDYTTRLHVIRMRDVLYDQGPGLLMGNSPSFVPYDPTQIGIAGGISVFPSIRGPNPDAEAVRAGMLQSEASDLSLGTPKGTKQQDNHTFEQTHTPSISPAPDPTAMEELANYRFDPIKPFTGFDTLRKNPTECANHPPSRYLKTFALSTWSPPPHPFRLRGHHMYLTVTTLELETFEITCHSKGFYINKCNRSQFDPSQRTLTQTTTPPVFYNSLIQLLCAVSPLFLSRLSETWNRALTPSLPDFFTSLTITNCPPAYPWLVNPPKPTADGIRTQLAYLLTGSATAESLPLARDWADEFAQVRELPRKTLQERTLRDRLWNRLQSDFSMAATRGVISCNRGEVPALNPHEPEAAWTYILNNMMLSRAEDPIAAYDHLGGTAAARAIASKDLASIKHLNELDVPGVYTMGSAVIDYHGKRWIVQGMLPGIFRTPDLGAEATKQVTPDSSVQPDSASVDKKPTNGEIKHGADETDWEEVEKSDASIRLAKEAAMTASIPVPTTYDILYGSVDIEKPELGLKSDPTFHALASKVAAGFDLKEHTVTDANGASHRLWLSADVHGIKATDGRYYLIDLYRMTPLDILFIEEDLKGPILNDPAPSDAEKITNAVSQEDSYPHRFTLIRSEAVSAFKQYKFRCFAIKQIQKRQKAASSTPLESSESIVEEGPKLDESNDEAFEFGFNPDACVDRKGQLWHTSVDKDEQSVADVRELSTFVREHLLPSVVQGLSEVKGLPADGQRLSDLLHSHGVNLRYIGHVAHRLEAIVKDHVSAAHKDDQVVILQAAIGMLHSEMVFRACKHILNRVLEQTSEAEACYCISHFLNCLLGVSPAIPHDDVELEGDAIWRTYNRELLQAEITIEVRKRYRYALPPAFFTERLACTKLQMLREICTRLGIQLALKDYQLYIPASEIANGLVQSTDDENSADNTPPPEAQKSSASKNRKKKKSKSKRAAAAAVTAAQISSQTFSPTDVLNLLPLVRDSTCRSSVADELYADGRKAFASGDVAIGQELCNDALATYEQVFGTIHPEMCRHWHSLAIMYHQLSQRASLEMSEYNERLIEMSTLYQAASQEADKEELKKRIQDFQRERDTDAIKAEIDTYIQLAAHNLRQSVIVAERTLGLDHPETIQQYSDLSVMEYSLGNIDTAMKYTKHALDLLHMVYGPGCHPDGSAAVTHAGFLAQSTADPPKHIQPESIFELSQVLIGSFFGKSSGKFAEATLILSQVYAQGIHKDLASKHGEDAIRLYSARFGEDHEQTKQASQLHEAITRSIQAQIKGDEEKSARLAKRLGLDPKRAASLRARLLATSNPSSKGHAKTSLNRATQASSPAAKVAYPLVKQASGPTIDELVKYIQGSPTKSKMTMAARGR